MSYPLVQFVSAPSRDAVVRFDCNSVGEWSDDDRWPEHDGFTLGFPSLSGDPEAIGVQYGTRSIEFNLIVRATPDAAFNAFGRLSREVLRPRNWLMVQFSAFSRPVWFHTYRTEQQALDFENVSGIDDTKQNVWGIGVRLAADPFAQGEPVTHGPFIIGNRATANLPWHVTLPDIAGDAPAPVRMRVQTSANWTGFTPMFSSIALDGGPYGGAPVVFSTQNATLGKDATAWVSDATFPTSGYVPIDFTTIQGLDVRVTDSTTVLPVGTYRVLVYASRSDTASTFRLQGRHARGSIIYGDLVDYDRATSPVAGHRTWVDLGLFTFPSFASMDDRDVIYAQNAAFRVAAQRLSGTGSLRLGALLYVPVETPWSLEARSYFGEFAAAGLSTANRTGEWDEFGNYTMLVTASLPTRSVDDDTGYPKPTGGLPVLVPGCTNTVTVLQQTNCHTPTSPTTANTDDVLATTTVTLDYAPRYLNFAGSEVL